MNFWKEWVLSSEAENRLSVMCSKLWLEKNNIWLDLLNYNFDSKSNTTNMQMEIDVKELNPEEAENTIHLIKQSLGAETVFQESALLGISNNSLDKILLALQSDLTETEFSTFCSFITSWTDDNLIEHALKLVVLPKLKEKNETSTCTTFSIKELAVKKPDKLCHSVLIPLLTDDSFQFTDVEFIDSVISVLQTHHKDLIILSLTKKKDIRESDWQLMQPFLQGISHLSSNSILECVSRFSNKFSTSQAFGRFLVQFCKNLGCVDHKDRLMEVVEGHQTLFKRQALKFVESLPKSLELILNITEQRLNKEMANSNRLQSLNWYPVQPEL